MKRKKTQLFLTSLLLLAMGTQLAVPALAQGRTYNDYDSIVSTGVDLKIVQHLTIAQPAKDLTTTASVYYITGTSNPESPVTINGETVERRGVFGTFGMQVSLEPGVNTFTVKNGGDTATVTITRDTNVSVAKTKKITGQVPTFNDMAYANQEYELKCTAPSGGRVTATVNGKTVELKQNVATAQDGVPAWYSAKVVLSGSDTKTENIGKIVYTLTFNGETTTYNSAGTLTLVGKDKKPTVEISQNSASIYEEDSYSSNFISTLNTGARDKVVDIGTNMVKLSMGGWVKKDYVEIVEGNPSVINNVADAQYQVSGEGEFLNISGTSASPFKSYSTSEKIVIKFYNMKDLPKFSVKNSQLFSQAKVSAADQTVTLELMKKQANGVLGYSVNYSGDNISVFFNPMPKLAQGDQPLQNVTVVVDPGHGGLDSGALGVLNMKGPWEKDITMASSLAVKKRLESLGANVIMTVPTDLSNEYKVELTERYQIALDSRADFFISLHCNSVGGTANDLKPQGTEIYYYESDSKGFADVLLNNLVSYTGRTSRGTLYGNYYVTRNTQCPSLLVEMGFVTNPVEYDNMRSGDHIFKTANAVGNSILEYLA